MRKCSKIRIYIILDNKNSLVIMCCSRLWWWLLLHVFPYYLVFLLLSSRVHEQHHILALFSPLVHRPHLHFAALVLSQTLHIYLLYYLTVRAFKQIYFSFSFLLLLLNLLCHFAPSKLWLLRRELELSARLKLW